MKRLLLTLCFIVAVPGLATAAGTPGAGKPPGNMDGLRVAPKLAHPEKAPIYASALAGKRIVAVGDYGLVILSDDTKKFRQATAVPTRAPLTSVYFVDDKQGWAAGHDGTILQTTDGGENWQLSREERGKERVLLSVWFENKLHGLAVGQFGLALETRDGGKTWQERQLVDGEAGEIHLLQIVPARGGLLFVAAEAGGILRSEDNGATWQHIQTDNKGSFWTGLALHDGTLLVAGLRGSLYRSSDDGKSWHAVDSGSKSSLTNLLEVGTRVVGVGLDGVEIESRDAGASFTGLQRDDRVSMTALVAGSGNGLVRFSRRGVLAEGKH